MIEDIKRTTKPKATKTFNKFEQAFFNEGLEVKVETKFMCWVEPYGVMVDFDMLNSPGGVETVASSIKAQNNSNFNIDFKPPTI